CPKTATESNKSRSADAKVCDRFILESVTAAFDYLSGITADKRQKIVTRQVFHRVDRNAEIAPRGVNVHRREIRHDNAECPRRTIYAVIIIRPVRQNDDDLPRICRNDDTA